MPLAGDGRLPRDQKETSGAVCRLWGFHCPRAEEADLRMVLGPREQLNPGGDPNGIKRRKRPVCEERDLFWEENLETLFWGSIHLIGSCRLSKTLQVLGYSACSWLSTYQSTLHEDLPVSVRCCHAEVLLLILWLKYISGDRFSCFLQNGSRDFAELLGGSAGLLHNYNYQKLGWLLGWEG